MITILPIVFEQLLVNSEKMEKLKVGKNMIANYNTTNMSCHVMFAADINRIVLKTREDSVCNAWYLETKVIIYWHVCHAESIGSTVIPMACGEYINSHFHWQTEIIMTTGSVVAVPMSNYSLWQMDNRLTIYWHKQKDDHWFWDYHSEYFEMREILERFGKKNKSS